MATDKTQYGVNGSFIFADCATIPNPTAEQLAEIAEASALSCRTFLNAEPKVAMLSYSTKGSAKGELVDKVVTATRLLKEKLPTLAVDGELQLDAAIVGSVAKSKAPGSEVAGSANTLVSPTCRPETLDTSWCRDSPEQKPTALFSKASLNRSATSAAAARSRISW
jgi:phosphate acetyltransferase